MPLFYREKSLALKRCPSCNGLDTIYFLNLKSVYTDGEITVRQCKLCHIKALEGLLSIIRKFI